MKLPAGLILLCLALTVSVRAEWTAQVKTEVPAVKRELVWPEIKDPQALIDFAKVQIAKVKASGREGGDLDVSKLPEIAYLHPLNCELYAIAPYEQMVIVLDTHPFNGQALLIVPDPKNLRQMMKGSDPSLKLTATEIPEIKRALLMSLHRSQPNQLPDLSGFTVSVNWRNIRNLDSDDTTWPKPLEMGLPVYPLKLMSEGMVGEAKVKFTVTEHGTVSLLEVSATFPEFESAVREAAEKWHYEPGVNFVTRLPSTTRISLIVKFALVED